MADPRSPRQPDKQYRSVRLNNRTTPSRRKFQPRGRALPPNTLEVQSTMGIDQCFPSLHTGRMDAWTIDDALQRGRAERLQFGPLNYIRFLDERPGLPRGTVILGDTLMVSGYPSIGRIQVLASGLQRHYSGGFWAEEKMDGFNVRILRHGDAVYAFSRGGFICPFATDRVPELMNTAIFDDHPELVVCAEIAGPENPYVEGSPPRIKADVELFVFDLMHKGREGFLPQEQKLDLVDRYGLPATRCFGRFRARDVDQLRALIMELDAEGAEGLVFKGAAEERRTKYVTGRSNITDIALCSEQLLDLPPEYFSNRLIRLAVFAREHGLREDRELHLELGAAFLNGLHQAMDHSLDHGRVGHGFRCRFRAEQNALRFMDHLKRTGGSRVQIAADMPRRDGDYWVLEFERVLERMTGTLSNTLTGGFQYD